MFADAECPSIAITHDDKEAKMESAAQTRRLKVKEASTEPRLVEDVASQTLPVEFEEVKSELPLSLLQRMVKELGTADPLEGFEPLRAETELRKYSLETQGQITALDWNSTGRTLVVAYGQHHWCEDPGKLCFWNFHEHHFVEHATCLTAVACHPSKPALTAAGSLCGEVLLFQEHELVAASDINEWTHCNAICGLEWHDDELYSLDQDGKLLVWSSDFEVHQDILGPQPHQPLPLRGVFLKDATCFALSQCILAGTSKGHVLKFTMQEKKIKTSLEWDRAALSFARYSAGRHKLIKHVENFTSKKRVTLEDIFESKPRPNYLYPEASCTSFKKHKCPVACIAASPFHRNLFVSVGIDGIAHVYSAVHLVQILKVPNTKDTFDLRASPHLVLCATDFSNARPLVFATAGDDGLVRVYDLSDLSPTELAIPLGDDHITQARIFALKFNPKQRDFLACATAAGHIHVWQLPWHLANPRPNERAKLDAFIEAHFFDD